MQAVDTSIRFGDKNKAAPWYTHNEDIVIAPEALELLEKYSHIAPEDVKDHVLTMRDKIWDVFPYPCVGGFSFLDLNLQNRPGYPRILARLQDEGARHLDVACCVGQDLRKLVFDGVPSEKTTAIELEKGYIEAGYELFRDKETLKTKFVNADLLADDTKELDGMEGMFDTVHMGACLHLWVREDQIKILKRIIKMMKQETGTTIIGHAVAHADGAILPGMFGAPSLRHNLQTWESMWADISKETGTRWRLRTEIADQIGHARKVGAKKPAWWDKDWGFLMFEVVRVE